MILFRRPYQRSPPGRSTLLAIKRRYNLRKWLIRITEIREGTHDRSPILGPDQLTPYTINPNTGGHAANNLDVHVTNAGGEKLIIYGGWRGVSVFVINPPLLRGTLSLAATYVLAL